jgi:hypothetical protein
MCEPGPEEVSIEGYSVSGGTFDESQWAVGSLCSTLSNMYLSPGGQQTAGRHCLRWPERCELTPDNLWRGSRQGQFGAAWGILCAEKRPVSGDSQRPVVYSGCPFPLRS